MSANLTNPGIGGVNPQPGKKDIMRLGPDLILMIVEELAFELAIDSGAVGGKKRPTPYRRQECPHAALLALAATSHYMRGTVIPIMWPRAFFGLYHHFSHNSAGPFVSAVIQERVKEAVQELQLFPVRRHVVPASQLDNIQKLVVPFSVFDKMLLCHNRVIYRSSRSLDIGLTPLDEAARIWTQKRGAQFPSVQHLIVTVGNMETIDRSRPTRDNEMCKWYLSAIQHPAHGTMYQRNLVTFRQTWSIIARVMPALQNVEVRRRMLTEAAIEGDCKLRNVMRKQRLLHTVWWPLNSPLSFADRRFGVIGQSCHLTLLPLRDAHRFLEQEDEGMLAIIHAELARGQNRFL